MSAVTLQVLFSVEPARVDDFAAALSTMVAATRQEVGCLQFDPHRHPTEPGRFLLFERWASREALDAHGQTAHLNTFVTAASLLWTAGPAVTEWAPLE